MSTNEEQNKKKFADLKDGDSFTSSIGTGQILKYWYDREDLSDREQKVLTVLLAHDGKSGCYPNLKTIAKSSRLHKRQTINLLQSLKEKKYIDYNPTRGRERPNRYTFKFKGNSAMRVAPFPSEEIVHSSEEIVQFPEGNSAILEHKRCNFGEEIVQPTLHLKELKDCKDFKDLKEGGEDSPQGMAPVASPASASLPTPPQNNKTRWPNQPHIQAIEAEPWFDNWKEGIPGDDEDDDKPNTEAKYQPKASAYKIFKEMGEPVNSGLYRKSQVEKWIQDSQSAFEHRKVNRPSLPLTWDDFEEYTKEGFDPDLDK